MVVLLTALPILASLVLTVCATSLTSTVSSLAATERAKSMVAGWLTSSSAVFACLPNPALVTVIVYLPGASCGNSYVPFWSVLRVMWEPVAALSRPTSAPASNAPEGSATVPRSEVSPVCDQRSAALPKNNAQNSSHLQQFISVSRTPEME